MKIPLYLVATLSHSGKQIVWISTEDMKTQEDVVLLDTFELEYQVKQSEDEIDTLLDNLQDKKIAALEAELKELRA